jgi:hypothetical protein
MLLTTGELQVRAQTQVLGNIVSQATVWSSVQDGFYYQESPSSTGCSLIPVKGRTIQNGGVVSLYVNSAGSLQILETTTDSSSVLFELAIPTCTQPPSYIPQKYEYVVRTAGMLLNTINFFDDARTGYFLCGLENISTKQILWQIPAVIGTSSSAASAIFPTTTSFTLWKSLLTDESALLLLTSGNSVFSLIWQNSGGQSRLGVILTSDWAGSPLPVSTFQWSFALVKSGYLYLTMNGNVFMTNTPVTNGVTTTQVTFQTYTSHQYVASDDDRVPFQLLLRNSGRLQVLDGLDNLLWNSPYVGAGSTSFSALQLVNCVRLSYTLNMWTLTSSGTPTHLQNGNVEALQSGINWTPQTPPYCPGTFLFSNNGIFCVFPVSGGQMEMVQARTNSSVPIWFSNNPDPAFTDTYLELFNVDTSSPFLGIVNQSLSVGWYTPVQLVGLTAPFTLSITNGGRLSLQDVNGTYVPVTAQPAQISTICKVINGVSTRVDPWTTDNAPNTTTC